LNAENEKGGAPGKVSAPSENFSDDTGTVIDSQPACKKQFPDWAADGIAPKPLRGDRKTDGKDAPPAGYGFADTADGEPKRLEPITMPPQDAEPEPPSELLELARRTTILYDWAHADEHTPKVAAVRVVLDQDRRDPKTIAASLGVSTELIRLRIRQARAVLAELRGEAVPATGEAKP
jgi:hypothetical protein